MSHDYAAMIESLVATYPARGIADNAYEINCGYCDTFAESLMTELSRLDPVPRGGEVWVDDFLVGEFDDDDRSKFDRDGITENFPNIVPPAGLTWDDMDQIAADHNFAGGTHVWVEIEGRHYDAEAPQGVDNPFDLPFFQRKIAMHLESQVSSTPQI